jgi:hypothetical protein
MQQILGKNLAGFDLGSRFIRAENTQAFKLKGVDDPGRQRPFRTDNGQVYFIIGCKADQRFYIACFYIQVFRQ